MQTELLLPATTAELSPVQKGWLQVAQRAKETHAALTAKELAIQGLLNGYEGFELVKIQEAIKKAKADAAESKDQRLSFTNSINEKLITPFMAFEKRNDELIAKASGRELELRKAENEKLAASKAKEDEKAALRAHITNEWARAMGGYKMGLNTIISTAYEAALDTDVSLESLPGYLDAVRKQLSSHPIQSNAKFDLKLLNREEAIEIHGSVPKPDFPAALAAAIKYMEEEKFAMYEQDLKNKAAAIEANRKAEEDKAEQAQKALEMEVATNTLIASAAPVTVSSGVKTDIKKSHKIVREDTADYAMKVMSYFLKNWQDATAKSGVKTWHKLVEPFAKALEKFDSKFEGLKYEEVEK